MTSQLSVADRGRRALSSIREGPRARLMPQVIQYGYEIPEPVLASQRGSPVWVVKMPEMPVLGNKSFLKSLQVRKISASAAQELHGIRVPDLSPDLCRPPDLARTSCIVPRFR